MSHKGGIMNTKQVVILGGGYAGVNAALRLRVRDKNVAITLVNERSEFVERIRNHQTAAGQTLTRHTMAEVLGRSIRFVAGRAEKIETAAKRVLVQGATGVTGLPYDLLIYALGSGAATGRPGFSGINTREDAEKLKADLSQRKNAAVVIVGAGLTGLELATEMREADAERRITLMDFKAPGSRLSEKAREYLNQTLAELKIGFEKLEEDPFADNEFSARLARMNTIAVDCTGFVSPDLARRSGLSCDTKNRVLVNEHLQAVDHPDILVAGDAAAYGFGINQITYAGCATASPMGTYAGEAATKILAGENPPEFLYGFTFQCISLGRHKGIIQFLDKRTGVATGRSLTGKSAAVFKELICKMTVTLPRWERKTRWPFYTWRKTRFLKKIGAMAKAA
jgi:NADH:ubiquinone reductase (H+-translocating)